VPTCGASSLEAMQLDDYYGPYVAQGLFTVVRAVGTRNKNRAVNRTKRVVNCWHKFDRYGLILFTMIFLYRTAAVRAVTAV
jgi:hypothetical protein